MNALVADDERLARSELRRLLAAHPDVSIVAEARNVEEAEAGLKREPVDLLFLDIQMPGGSGFDLLERLDRMPLVIFTTAFDQYAIRAFEVNALDYLMKPVAPERLAAALDRVRQRAGGASRGPLERVFVREGERCWIVNVADIRLLESEGNYTRLYFGVHRPLILRSLQALEARLDSAVFFRASRSRIMNLRWVAGVDTDVDGGLIVTLRDGPKVPVSRRQSRRLRDELSL
ncbi:MAG: DNA-binding response regulator [Acidobacteria bacterium]|nr:MAG: DNA-binding response regulator [Acidobacteriota bacterium]